MALKLRPALTKFSQFKRAISTVQDLEALRTLKFDNGQNQPLLFTKGEYESRLDKIRKHMSEENLSACIFTSYHNIAYFTNFLFCGFGRPYAHVVTPESNVTISALVDGGQPGRTSFGDNLVYTDWKEDNYIQAIKEVLGDKSKGKIGVEFDHLNLQMSQKLMSGFGKEAKDFQDVGVPTMKMRMVKTREELALYKKTARIADIGGFAVRQAIAEGVHEHEIASIGTKAMVDEICRTFGPQSELRDTWVWLQSGPQNTDGAHNPVTSRRLQKGDILSLNCFPMVQSYYTALERTLFLGQPSDDHLKLWEANLAAHYKGCELLKPGVKCSEIAKELNDMVASQGLLKYRTFGYGHSFGVLCHYYGREAGLELREDVDTVLEPGMVISMEPMVMIPMGQPGAGGYREHDILIINEKGAENITKFPLGPDHNIIN